MVQSLRPNGRGYYVKLVSSIFFRHSFHMNVGPPNLKRKRGDWDDGRTNDGFIDDGEPIRRRAPVLPVAKLPDSFDGVPQDGLEYLFTVR